MVHFVVAGGKGFLGKDLIGRKSLAYKGSANCLDVNLVWLVNLF